MTGAPSTPALREFEQMVDEGFEVQEVTSTDRHVVLLLRNDERTRTLALNADEALELCEARSMRAVLVAP